MKGFVPDIDALIEQAKTLRGQLRETFPAINSVVRQGNLLPWIQPVLDNPSYWRITAASPSGEAVHQYVRDDDGNAPADKFLPPGSTSYVVRFIEDVNFWLDWVQSVLSSPLPIEGLPAVVPWEFRSGKAGEKNDTDGDGKGDEMTDTAKQRAVKKMKALQAKARKLNRRLIGKRKQLTEAELRFKELYRRYISIFGKKPKKAAVNRAKMRRNKLSFEVDALVRKIAELEAEFNRLSALVD